MPWTPSQATPRGDPRSPEPRFNDLFVDDPEQADVLLCGIPYDGAVLGRRGAREGPDGIRAAFRWLGTDGLAQGPLRRSLHDLGDIDVDGTVLEVHDQVQEALTPVFRMGRPVIVLGGDNSLSFPVAAALSQAHEIGPGRLGLVVVDAHYDLRTYEGQPSSGTPYRRILTEMPRTPLWPRNLIEVGIRPYANAAALARFAAEQGIHIVPRDDVRRQGPEHIAAEALRVAGDGTGHLWLSVDIDAFDQSIAAGCSAPSPDGLLLNEVAPLIQAVARDPRCLGMEIMEAAPSLDPSGNTTRTAASLVTMFCAAARQAPP